MSFDEVFKSYIEQYEIHKLTEVKLDVIKQGIKDHYDKQEEHSLKINGVVARLKTRREYKMKDEIYDYLEDYGYLPLVTTISKNVEKYFNVEKAKINHKHSIRLYTGGKSIVDKQSITSKYEPLLQEDLEELVEHFKRTTTEESLEKAKLEQIKEQLIEVMPTDSVSTHYGTLKITRSYEYDIDVVFEGISGKKEVLIKKTDTNTYKLLIYPEDKMYIALGNDRYGNKTVNELFDTGTKQYLSIFLKKREFNQFIKDGFTFNHFEVAVDPYDFLRKCEVSKTKINELIEQGIINEKDIEPYYELIKETDYIEVLSESSVEQQSDLFHQRLINRSENLRRRNDESYVENDSPPSNSNPQIDFSDFSF